MKLIVFVSNAHAHAKYLGSSRKLSTLLRPATARTHAGQKLVVVSLLSPVMAHAQRKGSKSTKDPKAKGLASVSVCRLVGL